MVFYKTWTGSEWNGLEKIFFMPCLFFFVNGMYMFFVNTIYYIRGEVAI